MSQGNANCEKESRAFDALTFVEERNRVLAKVHTALAARARAEHLRKEEPESEDAAEAREAYDNAWEELSDAFSFSASQHLIEEKDLRPLLFSVPDPDSDPLLLFQALRICSLGRRFLQDGILNNREAMLGAVRISGKGLKYVDNELKGDRELVRAALAADPLALEYASGALQADREIVMQAVRAQTLFDITVRNYGSNILSCVSEELQDDKEVILTAVEIDGWALAHASENLKGDRDIVLAALRKQTIKDIADCQGHNVIELAHDELRADKEVLLEAVRVQGTAVEHAHIELRQDKDFLLQVARSAPPHDCRNCYDKADESVRQSVSFADFQGAAESALAAPGEPAPVLSVSMVFLSGAVGSCEVSLLSGASFTCDLTQWADPPYNDHNAAPDPNNEETDEEPPYKRSRTTKPPREKTGSKTTMQHQHQQQQEPQQQQQQQQQQQPDLTPSNGQHSLESRQSSIQPPSVVAKEPQKAKCLTLAELADEVLAELSEHLEMDPFPERVFIAFTKHHSGTDNSNGSDIDGDHIPVTPWDWNRPVSDFL